MAMATATTTTKQTGCWKSAVRRLCAGCVPCVLGLTLVSATAQRASGQMMPGPTVAVPATAAEMTQAAPLLLGPGDLVEVQVFNTVELSGRVRLDQMGVIHLPVGGELDVNGLTPSQAGHAVEQKLHDAGLMVDPHVTIYVVEYATQGVTLLGEVRSPGTYNLFGPHSLYDAVSAAGGVTVTAGASITITHRKDPEHPVVIPVNSPNYSQLQRMTLVEPGDTILVAKAAMFYVVGDIGHPGAFYMQNGESISVLNALALAGGAAHTAKMGKASIIRPTTTGAETIPLDLNKIMRNEQPNVQLLAADILVVPRSGLKVLLETVVPGATAAVTSAVVTSLAVR